MLKTFAFITILAIAFTTSLRALSPEQVSTEVKTNTINTAQDSGILNFMNTAIKSDFLVNDSRGRNSS